MKYMCQCQAVQIREKGGPCMDFCKIHELIENKHPVDWFNPLMSLTPEDNLEDIAVFDVTGDRKIKFCVANWAAYTATKAQMANTIETGHIFAG
eukprot:180311-Ditylum_brightwellii.AAC.1